MWHLYNVTILLYSILNTLSRRHILLPIQRKSFVETANWKVQMQITLLYLLNYTQPLPLQYQTLIRINHLTNWSFENGHFPATLRRSGNISAAKTWVWYWRFKKRNFLPITNLTVVNKIIVKLALSWLKPHVMASHNYCPFQSA